MTMEKMIETIQEAEQEHYDEFKTFQRIFGEEAETTKRSRAKWSTIYNLCQDLGIPT